jgi:hypothetical protein
VTELRERERVDQGPEELGQDLAAQEAEERAPWVRVVGRASLEPAEGDQG